MDSVEPGTFELVGGGLHIKDNGQGLLVCQKSNFVVGTINYVTGQISEGVLDMALKTKQTQLPLPKQVEEVKQGVAKSVSSQVILTADERSKVSEYVLLKRDLEEVNEKIKLAEKLRKDLQSIAESKFDSGERVVFSSDVGEVAFAPAGDKRKISDVKGLIAELKKQIGYEALLTLINISLTDADKYLGKANVEAFVTHEAGPRSVDGYTVYE